MTDSLGDLSAKLARFAEARDWSRFHSPKNLASALIVEAAELLEHFQWMTEQESRSMSDAKRSQVQSEIADVLLYLVQLCTATGIDPIEAANEKIAVNEQRYPVALAKGTSRKYSDF